MDELTKTLTDRESTPAGPTQPNTKSASPSPAWQRYETAQRMQEAYRNNWNPNPILIRLLNK